jgi:hypothetical protein
MRTINTHPIPLVEANCSLVSLLNIMKAGHSHLVGILAPREGETAIDIAPPEAPRPGAAPPRRKKKNVVDVECLPEIFFFCFFERGGGRLLFFSCAKF